MASHQLSGSKDCELLGDVCFTCNQQVLQLFLADAVLRVFRIFVGTRRHVKFLLRSEKIREQTCNAFTGESI